jgi:hypothetical protein
LSFRNVRSRGTLQQSENVSGDGRIDSGRGFRFLIKAMLWAAVGTWPPINCSEPFLAEQRVADAQGSDRLVGAWLIGVVPIAARLGVTQRDAMQVIHAHGQ